MNSTLKLGLVLFFLGLVGVLSLLTAQVPSGLPAELTAEFSPQQIQLLTLINPIFLLLLSVVVGALLYRKVGLEVPTLSALLGIGPGTEIKPGEQLKMGIALGVVAGLMLLVFPQMLKVLSPAEYNALAAQPSPTLLVRLLYGGITEEILIRFGLMTLIVWLGYKVTGKLSSAVFWTGIILAAIVFGIGHFPVAFALIPEPTSYLFGYVLLGNAAAGFLFGWLYWKKGLESAVIAHMVAHVTVILTELAVA